MENKIFELMLKNSEIADIQGHGEVSIIDVEKFRDIARDIVKLIAIPDVSKFKKCSCSKCAETPSIDDICLEEDFKEALDDLAKSKNNNKPNKERF